MKIALDFDDTFTLDTELWTLFVLSAIRAGHEVAFVTYRDSRWGNTDIEDAAYDLGIKVIYTAGRQKANFFAADIWIDDEPVTIPRAPELGDMFDGCLANNDMI